MMTPMNSPQARPSPALKQWSWLGRFERVLALATTVPDVLQVAAESIADAGFYRRVVISLHDSEGNLGPIGSVGIPHELIEAARRAPRVSKEVREAVLQERFRIGGSYFVPVESGIDLSHEERRIPLVHEPSMPDGWQAGDELFTPLCAVDGSVLGFCSVDDPVSGLRPTAETIPLFELIINRAANRIEAIRLQSDLEMARVRLSRLIEHTDDVVYEIDFTSNCYRAFSRPIRVITGIDAASLSGLSFSEWLRRFVHPDDRDRVRVGAMDFPQDLETRSRRTLEHEYRILHTDGSVRWVRDRAVPVEDEDGQVVAVQGFIRDVTAVRSLSGELVKTEKRYRLMADNASDLIYAHDATGHIYYASPSVERYLGATPEEFIGTHFSEWLSDNPINSIAFEAFDAEINTARTVTPFILELKARDGHTFLMEFNESLIRDRDERVIGVQGVGRDVTEREETLTSLREHRRRLDAANTALKALVNQSRRRQERAVELNRQLQEKNAELESFVQIVSHDLRSPLITLRGLAAQLRRRFSSRLDENGKTVIQQIGEEATRLSHLIGDLLVYARASANPGARRAVDAGLMMDTVWTRLVESGRAEGASFTRPLESRLVWADPIALERVFENLMSNAVTHRHPDRLPRVEATWRESADRIEFEMRDNGIGIEPEDRPHIFELFYRGRNAQTPGSGLGLAIVKRIVETSGASINSSANADGGSTFTLVWLSRPPARDPD